MISKSLFFASKMILRTFAFYGNVVNFIEQYLHPPLKENFTNIIICVCICCFISVGQVVLEQSVKLIKLVLSSEYNLF